MHSGPGLVKKRDTWWGPEGSGGGGAAGKPLPTLLTRGLQEPTGLEPDEKRPRKGPKGHADRAYERMGKPFGTAAQNPGSDTSSTAEADYGETDEDMP